MNNRIDVLVTIGIPTFNRADTFLKETLQSTLNQTYKNIEIIVSDNCSSDNTEQLLGSYKDDRIRYYRQQKNIGAIRNMNYCLEKARGDYFLMLHDDDLIDPDFIERCLHYAGYTNDKGIIIAGAREIDMQGEVLIERQNLCSGMSAREFLSQWYNKKILLFLPSILFNTAKLKEIGGFQEAYHFFADVAAQFILICTTPRIDVPDVLGSFRVTMGSFGKNAKIVQWCDNSIALVDLACSLISDDDDTTSFRTAAMKTSAERMYREALRAGTLREKIRSFYIVWDKFDRSYYPTRNQLAQLYTLFYFILFPLRTIKRGMGKMLRLFQKVLL